MLKLNLLKNSKKYQLKKLLYKPFFKWYFQVNNSLTCKLESNRKINYKQALGNCKYSIHLKKMMQILFKEN